MAERLDMSGEENFLEISRTIEEAWRIVTRPQDYSRYKVRKAEDLLDKTKVTIFAAMDIDATVEEVEISEALMLGFYHYVGAVLPPGILDEPSLN